jgi:hypothetical protein
MSKQNITHIPHPYLWGPTDRYTPFYSLFRDKLSLPRELVYQNCPLGKRYCESLNQDKDVQQLAEDCMFHQCNKYCLRSAKTNTNGPRTCRVYFGMETKYGKQDTQGLPHTKRSKIFINRKGILHFKMKRTTSVRVVQHSRTLLRGWRANCNIKLLLYYSNPN